MRRGREPHHEETRFPIPERRDRPAPVVLARETLRLRRRHGLAVAHEPRTVPADDDFLLDSRKRLHSTSLFRARAAQALPESLEVLASDPRPEEREAERLRFRAVPALAGARLELELGLARTRESRDLAPMPSPFTVPR